MEGALSPRSIIWDTWYGLEILGQSSKRIKSKSQGVFGAYIVAVHSWITIWNEELILNAFDIQEYSALSNCWKNHLKAYLQHLKNIVAPNGRGFEFSKISKNLQSHIVHWVISCPLLKKHHSRYFSQAPLKSPNCPSPCFLGNSTLYIGFSWTPNP